MLLYIFKKPHEVEILRKGVKVKSLKICPNIFKLMHKFKNIV